MTPLDELSSRKRELAEKLLRKKRGDASPRPIARRADRTSAPLSYAQEQLWVLQRVNPDDRAYNLTFAIGFPGGVDESALRLTLNEIVRRHEGLRTIFPIVEGRPVQVVQSEASVLLEVVDLPPMDEEMRRAQLRQIGLVELRRPVDLERGPITRGLLVRSVAGAASLFLSIHHIAIDEWSTGVLVNEIQALYAAFSAGSGSPLEEQPIQYADFAAWQRDPERKPAMDAQLVYWKRELAGLRPARLSIARDRPAEPTRQSERESLLLSAAVTKSVREFSRKQGLSLFSVLLAGFSALLERYTGQHDVVIGSPAANRERAETGGLIGFFVNMVVLRTAVEPQESFRELARRAQTVVAGALAHQDVPFERIVSELAPQRTYGENPLFQITFDLRHDTAPSDIDLTMVVDDVESTRFDLEVHALDDGHRLRLNAVYSTDLFAGESIARLLQHFETLLESAIRDDQRPVHALEMLSRDDLRAISRAAETPSNRSGETLCAAFERHAALRPDAVATEGQGSALTYRELDTRANRLAGALRERGVDRGSIVAICLERGHDFVVAMLAVMKAGAAYVPLDPDYPRPRLEFMLNDCGAAVVLTHERLKPGLLACVVNRPAGSRSTELVCLDGSPSLFERQAVKPDVLVSLEDVAYVIYTSGSTGRPKGVLVPHRGLANVIAAQAGTFGVRSTDRVLQFSSPSFDASVFDIAMALGSGATLLVPAREDILPGPSLGALLSHERVSVLTITPSSLTATPVVDAPTLRVVSAAGEACPAHLVRRWGSGRRFFNLYGPTEATIWTTAIECAGDGAPTIGRAISNVRAYVVDGALRLVAPGMAGELLIGGEGVAHGYLGRPALTAERFVPDSISGVPGARLYRSGDLARYTTSGEIEYIGRADEQVKLRGFRIELGDIDEAIRQHPDVLDAATIVHEDASGHRRLVAYCVGREETNATANDLSRFVKQLLPLHMLPAVFVMVRVLPLTPNGKLDRAALPDPDGASIREEASSSAARPQSAAEHALATIWMEVLRVASVGVDDNFFELGGDSILSIQIVSRAQAAGLRLTAKDVFKHQTIAELAAVIDTRNGMPQAPMAAAPDAAPLIPIQRWFFEQDFADPHHFNQAVFLEATHHVDAAVVERALRELVAHHDALRLRVTSEAKGLQHVAPPDALSASFIAVDVSHLADHDRDSEMEAVAARLQAGLSLEGPLVSAALFDCGSTQPQKLFIAIHHIAVDGVSWRVLLEDLECACRQLSDGGVVQLPPKTAPYLLWAERLNAYAQTHEARDAAGFWARRPDGDVAIPLDDVSGLPNNTVGEMTTVTVTLTEAETDDLLHASPRAFRTQINDVLLTAVALAVSRWAGRSTATINLEGHGREALFEDVDLSRTVGWCTSLFPVSLAVADSADSIDTLKLVKEQLRAVPDHGIGFGVARYLADDPDARSVARAWPHPQVSFNYLGRFDPHAGEPAIWKTAALSTGLPCSARGRRPHLIDIIGSVRDGRLAMHWHYCPHVHRRETVERVAADFLARVKDIVVRTATADNAGATPSDFPQAALDQRDVDRLCARYPDLEDIYALSPLQEGLLFHTLLDAHDGDYIEQLTMSFDGDLDVEAMRRAWQAAVDRHSILRTCFVWSELAAPVQVVRRRVDLRWSMEDWRGERSAEQQQRLQDRRSQERLDGFDLAEAPPLRLTVVRLGDREYSSILTFHHLLLDGWSMQVLFREVSGLYLAFSASRTLALPPAAPFSAYIRWIEGHRDNDQAEAFWRRQLMGAPDSTILSLPKPDARKSAYKEQWLRLSEEDSERLRAAARRHQITLNSFVQVAWALLLARYTGQDDVIFGATVAGRPSGLPGVETMIGLFINTLPVRVQLSHDRPLLSVIRDLQEQQVAARDFEHVRLSDVQRWSGAASGDAWFDTLLAFENYPVDRSAINRGDVSIGAVEVIEPTHYALTAVAVPGVQVAIRVSFDAARFTDETVGEMLECLGLALDRMSENPEALVRDVALCSPAERSALLALGTGADEGYPPVLTVDALFEQAVEQHAESVAVQCGHDSLTYRELDDHANQWAHVLRRHGAGPDVVVGVCLEGGLELIAVLLGIIKAGGAYLALDPAYPTSRLRVMMDDTRASLVITDSALRARMSLGGATILLADQLRDTLDREPRTRMPAALTPDHLAYVSYTSGSTGRPKGVGVPHRGIVRLLFGVDYASFGPHHAWLQLAPVGFDASTLEIWGALLHGGRLVVATDRMPTPEALGALLAEKRVTSVWLTASLFNAVVDAAPEALRPVQQLLIGGEALSVAHVRRALDALPDTRIINGYGPTESTTFTCCHPIADDDVRRDTRSVSIGRPIGHTYVSVLDASGDPAPMGVVGELFIGGDGLSRGYIGQPARTAERFVPDPHGRVPGARLYRTGDRVRWTPQGVLEFVGRIDTQVKIRGFRVEPSEVEVAIGTHAAVQTSAVIVREDIPGAKRLIAYIVEREGESPADEDLRQHLRQYLPDYMMPASFVRLRELPRTANGKLDRDALPAPEAARTESRQPATPAELALAAIWVEVLGVSDVGIDENYFELGGDSILSIQICSRAQRAGWDLTPKQLFEHQTIAGAASVMRQRSASGAAGAEVSGRVAMLPAQRWFFDQNFADPHHFTQGMMLEVRESVSASVIDRALHALVAHHDVLRARFKRSDAGWTQHILPSKAPAIGLVSRVELTLKERSAPAAAIERAAIAVQSSLDLESGPLLRAVVFEAPGIRSRLLMVIHHLLVDVVSWRVLLEDLELACRQIQQAEPVQLPSRTSSVREWAEALSDFSRQPSLEAARDWWLDAAAMPAHSLPVDYPGGTASNTAGSSARVSVALTEEETQVLLQTVPKAYYTQINDALLTAMLQAIAPWAQSNTLLVDLEGHGREPISDAVDLTRTVGWFTGITPVPLTLPPDSDIGAALRAIKEQLRGLPGGMLAYGALRYFSQEAGTKASLAAGARAEVAFNYLGQVDRMLPGDALFSVAPESSGPTSSPRQRRPHLLDVVGFVSGAQLRFEWIYSPHVHGRGTIEALARRFVASLRAIISHCANTSVSSHTPSDFPLARVDQRGLDLMRARHAGLTIADLYPASPLQQGMLFHSLAAPNSSVFTTQVCCHFDEDLDVAALRRAWADALGRHAILRTAFVIDAVDEFHQAVFQDVQLPWTVEDWSRRPAGDRDAALADWLRGDRARGFDVSRAPLMRMAVITLEERRHCFVWTHHHALLDGWSFAMVLGEVFAAYQSRHAGSVVRFAHRPPYRDYIAWLQRQDRAAAERYWRETLAGFTGATALSVDEARNILRSGAETHDEQILYVDEAATRRIEALAHEHRVTLNTVVQGAWAMLLSKYSGDTDVVFGTTVSGRPSDLPGVEEMIGLFMNGLPLRVELPAQQPLAEWLQTLQRKHLEMREHEGTALVDIQGWSEVPRGAPLFDTTLVFENYPEGESLRTDVRGAGMSAAQVVSNTSSALHLRAIPGRRLALRLVHDSERFSAETADRMVRQLEHLLHAFTEHSRAPLSSFSLLTPADAAVLPDPRRRLSARWNGGVHEEFSRVAERFSSRPAIVDGGGSRSYGEVDRRSNQIAHALRENAVGRGDVVAILGERNAELVEAALGVLKSGAAFVILDLAHPASRLADLARIANARGMIRTTEGISPDVLASLQDLEVRVDLNIARGTPLERYAAEPLDIPTRPDDLAYVAFTSGSTGRPKGVLGLHGSLAQFAHSAADQFGLGDGDRFAALSALSHDPLLRDIFPPLQLGATLHVPDAALMGMPSRLVEWMRTSEVTTCNLTPALARLLTDVEEISVPSLRHAFIVGEVLTAGDVARLKRLAPQVSCVNFYGSTETQQALAWQAAADAAPGSRLPIGCGMDGVQLLVVTDGGALAGVGEVGEICVRTPYLASGYADASLTPERFQQNPFSGEPGDRVYRSGDRGRYLPNGAVAFVGRRDAQVKIRGFRVEPAEVEAVLMSCEGVREAAVVPYGGDRDDRVLAAYVVGAVQAAELRSFISARLPAAMIPAHFVNLERLPRTATGKLNRLALPEPDRRDEGTSVTRPMSPFEETLAGFWRELLRLEHVGPDASFFDHGGHSLLAARLIARVRDEFQVEMPIRSLFEHPTIAEFALAITQVLLDEESEGDDLVTSVRDLSDQSIQELIDEDASLVGDQRKGE